MASQVLISSQGIVSIPDSSVATVKLADGAVTPIKTSGGYSAQTTTYSATANDRVVDCTSGTFQVTVPAAASNTGRLLTVRNSGSGVITLGRSGSDTIGGATSQVIGGKGSVEIVSNGSAWLVVRGTYTDETSGRCIFIWDDVNNRWNLTFGDTGWRDVSAAWTPGANVTLPYLWVRRMNGTVQLVVSAATATTVSGSLVTLFTTPSGFSPNPGFTVHDSVAASSDQTPEMRILTMRSSAISLYGSTAGKTYRFTQSFMTLDSWPTSLPGVASGGLPYV